MTASARRSFAIVLIALAVVAFSAQQLSLSALRRQPRYDEVSYLSLAREYQRLGGATSAIGCYVDGRCHEDNRFPAYLLALQAFAHDAPGFYADAKLLTLGIALLLMALAGVLAWRVFSPATGVATVALLALLPTLGEIASGVLADVMYAAVLLACVTAIGAALERGPLAWLGAGAVIGLAYLTKGNAHLAFLGLVTAGLVLRGRRLLLAPNIYAAAAGFVAVTSFLLWRNAVVFKNPFHNFNDHALWLDGWNDVWRVLRDPEWEHIGPRWYLQHHSLWALAWRIVKGAGQTIGVLLYTIGPGVTAGTPADLRPTILATVLRTAGGVAIMALAARGLVDRHRNGHRAQVLAVTHVGGWMLLAFAVGAQGVGGVGTRFMLPFAVLCIPYAAHTLVSLGERGRTGAWLARPWARLALLAPFAIKLAWFAPAFAANPRAAFTVPPRWAETSAWLTAHLRPGERYAAATSSLYSTWDNPFPDPDARWLYLFDRPADKMLADLAVGKPASIESHQDGPPPPVTKVLVDMAATDVDRYRDKMAGPADDHGPPAFLGWPRCFADGDRPSRFLIYCRP
jgi:4-amino-4-deoxy-L-arabinose transferase-like glycosyltransferase